MADELLNSVSSFSLNSNFEFAFPCLSNNADNDSISNAIQPSCY